ncbi:VPLPA-CTERM sorting domain-containing protein [Antarctobacter jejuensis]|uniref:VPLPA-CTERM sorting domain-containing protein n=1 Tax=Antarctobacter jejuensis TaxID=1439938 RepID=UPI003FCFEF6F
MGGDMKNLFLGSALLFAGSAVQAATILEFVTSPSLTTPTLAASATGTGVTATEMTAGSGLVANTGSTWNWRDWTNGDGSVNTDSIAAITNGNFWNWSFSSTKAYDLDAFDILLDRSSTGPRQFELLATINGGSATVLLSDDFGDSASPRIYADVDLSAYTEVTSMEFYLAAFGADSGGALSVGTFDLEKNAGYPYSFQLRGDKTPIAPVPLPAGGLMLLAGIAALAMSRRT